MLAKKLFGTGYAEDLWMSKDIHNIWVGAQKDDGLIRLMDLMMQEVQMEISHITCCWTLTLCAGQHGRYAA